MVSKHIRIADLYALAIKGGGSGGSDVPDLADRLHALEVACYDICSDVLADDPSAVAVGLRTIKEKYRDLVYV